MLQKEATAYGSLPPGFPGQIARASVATVTEVHTVFDSANPIKPGDFLIGEIDNTTKDIKFVKLSKGNIQNKYFVGVCIDSLAKIPSISRTASIPNGHTVTCLRQGAVYIQATADAQAGHYVHLKEADGSVVYDASTSKASHMFTGFQVVDGGKNKEMIVIQRL